MLIDIVDQRTVMLSIFAFKGIDFLSLKLVIISPNILWLNSQLYSLSELFANKNADKSRKGVVGSRGRNIPITPSDKLITPNPDNKIFIQI